MPNSAVVALKMRALQPQKSPKMIIFGINLLLRENPGCPYKNLNIVDAQLQTFFYAMAP